VPGILNAVTVSATWDYKGGFGLRRRGGKPDEELVGILVPK